VQAQVPQNSVTRQDSLTSPFSLKAEAPTMVNVGDEFRLTLTANQTMVKSPPFPYEAVLKSITFFEILYNLQKVDRIDFYTKAKRSLFCAKQGTKKGEKDEIAATGVHLLLS
jgi:hypothetical protein